MKRFLSMVLCLALLLSLAACGGGEAGTSDDGAAGANEPDGGNGADEGAEGGAGNGGDRLVIATVLQSQQIVFWQHVLNTWNRLAEEHDFDLVVMDADSDVSTFQNCIDDLLVLKPDGVALCGVAPENMDIQIKQLQDAGIPVIAYNIVPDEEVCPIVLADNFSLGYLSGKAGAEWWQQNRPDEAPVGAALGMVGYQIVTDRVNGFAAGFQEVFPDFEIVMDADGNATRAESLNATHDILQAHPEANVFFGINGDSALGALDALKESGLGTNDKTLVCGIDATEGECQEMKDENSALRLSAGNSPKLMAEAAYSLLRECMDGARDAWSYSEYPLEYVLVTAENADSWTGEHFE